MGLVVFIVPITDWRAFWREQKANALDPHYFWHVFVCLKRSPDWRVKGYIKLSNIVSLFWIWGYVMYLAGWLVMIILRAILWIYRRLLRDYFGYVSDLFKTK